MSRLRLSDLSKELRNLANRIPLTEDSTPDELANFLLEVENLNQESQSLKIVDMNLDKYGDSDFWEFLRKTLPMLNSDNDMTDVYVEIANRIKPLSGLCKWTYAYHNKNQIVLRVNFPSNPYINGDEGVVDIDISYRNPTAIRSFMKGDTNIYRVPLDTTTPEHLQVINNQFKEYCDAVNSVTIEHKVAHGRKYFCAVFDDVDKSNLFIEAMEFAYGYKVGVLTEELGKIYIAFNSDKGVEVE